MNREILFRGKRVDNGAWETGSLVKERMWTSEERVFIADKMTGYHTPVIPETVGQYTGLTDRNGRKIFEGDVIEYHDKRYVIKYLEKYMRFSPSNAHAIFAVFDYTQSEIIGNIHDDPELLKGETNE